ncbi:MAG TPA: sulfurtransferase TusA family protein [Planctomycetota bacterium]|mgnify:CR=1 FL=1|nr:sulfurtransferase TusA family protein [Planctomycetota bacterium]
MMLDESWYSDARTLPARVHAVLATLERHRHGCCSACSERICGHSSLFSFILGYGDQPLCPACLALATSREQDVLALELAAFAASKECLAMGLRRADQIETLDAGMSPRCPYRRADGKPAATAASDPNPTSHEPAPSWDCGQSWDAGDLGCGELALELRQRLAACPPGTRFLLITTDSGAVEDVPAWCRLVGHRLIHAVHPRYLIQRKA